LNKNLFYY